MVNSENVIHFMEEIAHKELLQKPQYIADCWKDIVCILLPSFPDFSSLSEKYELLIPSTSKILSCLEANPGSEIIKVYKVFSGSDLMLFDAIHVNFTNLSGLDRRPIVHTCNTVMELSLTYQSFPELGEEFSSLATCIRLLGNGYCVI